MKSKYLMMASAVVMGLAGVILIFAADEVMSYLDITANLRVSLIFQLAGALYFSFAILNWKAKDNIIGGVYSKPVALGNLMHFLVGGMALIKAATGHSGTTLITGASVIYLVFAILFALVMFRHPAA